MGILDRTKVKNTLLRIAIVVLVIIAIAVPVKYYLDKDKSGQKNYATQEERSAATDNQLLKDRKYKEYQLQQTFYANAYIDKKQYSQAERLLNKIVAEVPQPDIISETYRSFWYLYLKTKDSANRQKYALLTAQQLKEEGKAKEAVLFEKDANKK